MATGVPPERCAEGFEPDGEAGCRAILPPEVCSPGTMALPGETSCRELAACGEAPWGDIPTEPTTQFVDADYAGNDSDGTAARPWTTIPDAFVAAAPGAVIAVAEGSYVANLVISGKPVRLWGRCPTLVTVTGTPLASATLTIGPGADGTEVHHLALAGPNRGIAHAASHDVVVDSVWFRNNQLIALVSDDALEIGSLTVRRALFENNADLGMLVGGTHVRIEQVVVRDTVPRPTDGLFGGGIEIDRGFATYAPADVAITSAIIERSHDLGVSVHGAHATLEGVLIRDMLPATDTRYGRGLNIEDDTQQGVHAVVSVQGLVIERVHEIGVFVAGSELSMTASVVRDVLPSADRGLFGRGVHVQDHPVIVRRGAATLDASLVERCLDVGVVAGNADLVMTGTIVRHVAPRASDGSFGDGISVLRTIPGQLFPGQPFGTAHVADSLIDGAARAGVSSFASTVTLERSSMRCSGIFLNGEAQDGVDFVFVDGGNNLCSCGDVPGECTVLSTMLVAPDPVP